MTLKTYFRRSLQVLADALPLRRKAGFTLLIAALVASIILTIASAIFDISQKQVALASLSQQSQYAFYAADTAAECALYWDERYSYFAATTPTLPIDPNPPAIPASPIPPTCGGKSLGLTPALINQPYNLPSCYYAPGKENLRCYIISAVSQPGLAASIQALDLFSPTSYCAELTVTKFLDADGTTVHTLIHADGFNTSCATITTNQNALERSVELSY